MATLRFGTDGVRGLAFDELTTDFAARLGHAAASVLDGSRCVIGLDTRESGPALRDALATGLAAGDVEAVDLGVVPTPAVAHAARALGAMGAMISASHNPWHDNGIKLFTDAGDKLSDGQQALIEQHLVDAVTPGRHRPPPPINPERSAIGDWTRSVAATVDTALDGLAVVLDAAHGAASHVAAPVLADLGADVRLIACDPDGRNINDGCGSTHPHHVAAAVREQGAAVGLALDGDADRLLCVDADGTVVDGDHLMAILALDMHQRRRLAGDTVVVTVMTNLGFHRAMAEAGIDVHVTPVGDRHILEALSTHRWSFGGEQSGHLIFRDHATTGDGLLSAVQVLDVMARTRRPLAALAAEAMTSFPQVLRNVRVAQRIEDPTSAIADEIAAAERHLGAGGRVLVRASGTEPLIRVMVEATTADAAASTCDLLCEAVATSFGE